MSESDNCKAGEERPREELTTKRIVSVLLADIVGLDDQEVPDWTNRIMTGSKAACGMVHELEKLCRDSCQKAFANNPSHDDTDLPEMLRRVMDEHDEHVHFQGHPCNKKYSSIRDVILWFTIYEVRKAFKEKRKLKLSDREMKALIAELTTRNYLYGAFLNPETVLEAFEETECLPPVMENEWRVCAVETVFVIREALIRGDTLSELNADEVALMSCILSRLGYVDERELKKLIRKIRLMLNPDIEKTWMKNLLSWPFH